MYVSMKGMLKRANEGNYAVMAINCFNIETARAVINAAQSLRAPIIINIEQEHMVNHCDSNLIAPIVKKLAQRASVEVALNFDHGEEIGLLKKALVDGYSSVMVDASRYNLEGNIRMTREIVEFAKKYDILIIHDNAYSDIIFDGAFGGSFLATPGAKEIGVEFFSLSKSFNVTGARLSFLVGRPDVIAALRKLRSQIDFGMFLPLQKAAVAALEGPLDSVKEQCQMYEERRAALCQGLRDIGWELPNGKGTMFVWAKIPGGRTDSMAFCMELMEKAGVIVTPGASFGPHGEGYVRFALVLPPEKIREAVEAIGNSGITVTK